MTRHASTAAETPDGRPLSLPKSSVLTKVVFLALAVVTVGAGAAVLLMSAPVPADRVPRTVAASTLPSGSQPIVVRECGTQTAEQPASMPIWCPTPEQYLDNLSWSNWGGAVTTATGDLRDTPCFCVGRAARAYPVTVTLANTGPKSTDHRYTQLTISFPGDRPDWAYREKFTFEWTTSGYISKETSQ